MDVLEETCVALVCRLVNDTISYTTSLVMEPLTNCSCSTHNNARLPGSTFHISKPLVGKKRFLALKEKFTDFSMKFNDHKQCYFNGVATRANEVATSFQEHCTTLNCVPEGQGQGHNSICSLIMTVERNCQCKGMAYVMKKIFFAYFYFYQTLNY